MAYRQKAKLKSQEAFQNSIYKETLLCQSHEFNWIEKIRTFTYWYTRYEISLLHMKSNINDRNRL